MISKNGLNCITVWFLIRSKSSGYHFRGCFLALGSNEMDLSRNFLVRPSLMSLASSIVYERTFKLDGFGDVVGSTSDTDSERLKDLVLVPSLRRGIGIP